MLPFPLGRLCLSLPADDVVRAKRKDIGNIMRSIEKRVWIGEMDDVCLTIEIWNSRYAPVVLLDPFGKIWIVSLDFAHQADAYFPDIGTEFANRFLRLAVESCEVPGTHSGEYLTTCRYYSRKRQHALASGEKP